MTDRYAVFGHPIQHSRSPFIHAAFAAQTGQDLTYEAIDATPEAFAETVRGFFAAGGHGANVTVPHKEAALALAHTASERAQRAGAANTLRREADGTLYADNTDGVGLLRDLTRRWGVAVSGRRVVLLGAGGAARGVLEPLLAQLPAQLVIANRTAARAEALVRLAQAWDTARHVELVGGGWEALAQTPAAHLVINATSASLAGETLPLPSGLIGPGTAVYDMMYGAEPTPFLRQAQALGAARTIDGLGMLVEQAAESFWLWRGVRPDTEPVYRQLRAQLNAGR